MARNKDKKSFLEKAVNSPGSLFSWIIDRIFGSTKTINGESVFEGGKQVQYNGLLGYLLDYVKALGRAISGFIENHEQAIAIAFWASLLISGGLTLAFHLAPAFLATVANFSLYGYSIAGIAGAEPLLQMGLAAGIAVVATSAVTYVTAALVNLITAINDCIYPSDEPTDPDVGKGGSRNIMITGLGSPAASVSKTPSEKPPVQAKSPIASGAASTAPSADDTSAPVASTGI